VFRGSGSIHSRLLYIMCAHEGEKVSMPAEPSGVLKHLKTLSPNHVYFLAPKAYVLRGFEYYAHSRLESYSWDRPQATLTATVRGTRHYFVQLRVDNGYLVYSCTCPSWTPESHCKHVICALLTTINLLVPDTFCMPSSDPERKVLLTRQLLPGKPEIQGPEPQIGYPHHDLPPQFEITLSN